jgi:hypothetical protein
MKNVKPIFLFAIATSETMIVERILVRVLPLLNYYGLALTVKIVHNSASILVPDELYEQILLVTEEFIGKKFITTQ